jgi:hypothetical protein
MAVELQELAAAYRAIELILGDAHCLPAMCSDCAFLSAAAMRSYKSAVLAGEVCSFVSAPFCAGHAESGALHGRLASRLRASALVTLGTRDCSAKPVSLEFSVPVICCSFPLAVLRSVRQHASAAASTRQGRSFASSFLSTWCSAVCCSRRCLPRVCASFWRPWQRARIWRICSAREVRHTCSSFKLNPCVLLVSDGCGHFVWQGALQRCCCHGGDRSSPDEAWR